MINDGESGEWFEAGLEMHDYRKTADDSRRLQMTADDCSATLPFPNSAKGFDTTDATADEREKGQRITRDVGDKSNLVLFKSKVHSTS